MQWQVSLDGSDKRQTAKVSFPICVSIYLVDGKRQTVDCDKYVWARYGKDGCWGYLNIFSFLLLSLYSGMIDLMAHSSTKSRSRHGSSRHNDGSSRHSDSSSRHSSSRYKDGSRSSTRRNKEASRGSASSRTSVSSQQKSCQRCHAEISRCSVSGDKVGYDRSLVPNAEARNRRKYHVCGEEVGDGEECSDDGCQSRLDSFRLNSCGCMEQLGRYQSGVCKEQESLKGPSEVLQVTSPCPSLRSRVLENKDGHEEEREVERMVETAQREREREAGRKKKTKKKRKKGTKPKEREENTERWKRSYNEEKATTSLGSSTKEPFAKEMEEQREEHVKQLAAKDEAFESAKEEWDRQMAGKEDRTRGTAKGFGIGGETGACENAGKEVEEWRQRCVEEEEQVRAAAAGLKKRHKKRDGVDTHHSLPPTHSHKHHLPSSEAAQIQERYQRWLDKKDTIFESRGRELDKMRERVWILGRENEGLRRVIRGSGNVGRRVRRRDVDCDRQSKSSSFGGDGSGIKIRVSNGRNVRLIDPRDLIRGRVR